MLAMFDLEIEVDGEGAGKGESSLFFTVHRPISTNLFLFTALCCH